MDIFRNIVQSKRRVVLSAQDREQLWLILRDYNRSHRFKDLQKPANHRRLWLKCSGALGQKLSHPGYYDGIKRQGFFYPNPAFIQIELDLTRTYPHVTDEAELKVLLEPLRNVLYAIVIRNPTIGYCQGMNFIAARLLSCMREEEAFWTMSQIVERYLPLDYYSNMIGVLVDQKVLQHFMRERLPRLCDHLDEMQFSLDLIAFQWIACLFAINLPQQIHFAVWDLFFIKGIVVIIRFALTILKLMEEEILAKDKFEDIYFLIDHYCQEKLDIKTLMEQFADRISQREIEQLREIKRKEIMEMLKKQLDQTQKSNAHQFPRLKFISNFQLYHGLSKYCTQVRPNISSEIEPNEAIERANPCSLIQQTLDKFEQDLMSIFDCDPSWPLCLYDFTHKNACPKYIAMRGQHSLETYVIDDYFFTSDARLETSQLRSVCVGHDEPTHTSQLPFDQLVIQRNYHVCQDLRHSNFVPFFKKRFSAQDRHLFQNPNLFFDIDDPVDACDKMRAFVASITEPLSDEIFDAVERFQRRDSMIALKRDIETITRLSRPVDPALIGHHMDEEFDRALANRLCDQQPAQSKRPSEYQHDFLAFNNDNDSQEEEKQPSIEEPEPQILGQRDLRSRTEGLQNQSISNLQMAVRMTLLEQAGLQKAPVIDAQESAVLFAQTSGDKSEGSSDELDDSSDAASAQVVQGNSNVMTFGTPASDSDKPTMPEADTQEETEEAPVDRLLPQPQPQIDISKSAKGEQSFFDDWGAQAMTPTLKPDDKDRLLRQMQLLRNKTQNLSSQKQSQEEGHDESEEEETKAVGLGEGLEVEAHEHQMMGSNSSEDTDQEDIESAGNKAGDDEVDSDEDMFLSQPRQKANLISE